MTPLLAQSVAPIRDLAVGTLNQDRFRTAGAVGAPCSIL